MITYSTILQGSEATEENARNFAMGFDFSEDKTEEYNKSFRDDFIDTVQGVEIYYNMGADYYFFAPEVKPETRTALFNYIDCITIPLEVAEMCAASGQQIETVKRCLLLPEVKAALKDIEPEKLKIELTDYGAWTPEELESHPDNLERILWIASGNIMDE